MEPNTFSRTGSQVPRIGGGDGALRRSLFRGRPRAAALSAIVPTLAVPKGATLFFLRGGDSRVGIATIMVKRRSADRPTITRVIASSLHRDDRARSQCELMKYEKRAETRPQVCNAYVQSCHWRGQTCGQCHHNASKAVHRSDSGHGSAGSKHFHKCQMVTDAAEQTSFNHFVGKLGAVLTH